MPFARAAFVLTGLVLVLGCTEVPLVLPEDACGAAALQDLVGQDLAALGNLGDLGPVRVIRPGMAVTMDYAPERLNVMLDEADLILSISCG